MAREDEVSRINVGKVNVGIVGLKAAMEQAAAAGVPSDEKGGEYLLGFLKPKSHRPPPLPEVSDFLRERIRRSSASQPAAVP
jgi:hypothetical protein